MKIPGAKNYETSHLTVEMDKDDLPEELVQELTVEQIWRVLQYSVQRQGLVFELTTGYISGDTYVTKLERVSSLVCNGLKEKVSKYGL